MPQHWWAVLIGSDDMARNTNLQGKSMPFGRVADRISRGGNSTTGKESRKSDCTNKTEHQPSHQIIIRDCYMQRMLWDVYVTKTVELRQHLTATARRADVGVGRDLSSK